MLVNYSNSKLPSILRQINFGSVTLIATNRPMGGGGVYEKSITATQQLDLVQDKIGGNCVRIGVTTTADGNADKPGYGNYDNSLKNALAACRERGIKVILKLDDRLSTHMQKTQINGEWEWEDDGRDIAWSEYELNVDDGKSGGDPNNVMGVLERCEKESFSMTSGFINRYKDYMDLSNVILELSNEPELFRSIQRENRSGTSESDFWPQKTAISMKGFKGMHDGARATLPELKISTPASQGWAPVWLYDQYLTVMPTVDFISWHWYDNMELSMNKSQWPVAAGGIPGGDFRSIFHFLALKWDKPVIISEANARPVNSNDERGAESGWLQQDKQIAFWSSFLPKAVKSGNCDAITAYNLLSDPYKLDSNGNPTMEAKYGLYYFPGIDLSLPKPEVDFQGTLTPKRSIKLLKWMCRDIVLEKFFTSVKILTVLVNEPYFVRSFFKMHDLVKSKSNTVFLPYAYKEGKIYGIKTKTGEVAEANFSRASTGTYIDVSRRIKTANINIPRYQHDAILIEKETTNYVKNNSNIGASNWTKDRIAVNLVENTLSDDGNPISQVITLDQTNTAKRFYQAGAATGISDQRISAFLILRNNNTDLVRYAYIRIGSSVTPFLHCIIDMRELKVTYQDNVTVDIKRLANNFFKVTVNGLVATSANPLIVNFQDTPNYLSFNPNFPVQNAELIVHSAQIEIGEETTSLIVNNTNNNAARAADIMRINIESPSDVFIDASKGRRFLNNIPSGELLVSNYIENEEVYGIAVFGVNTLTASEKAAMMA